MPSPFSHGDYQATLTRLTPADLDTLGPRWRELEERCDCSFFQSWSWMGSWLATAIDHVELYLFECRKSDETVALATLSRATIRRRHLFRVTQLTLNDAPLSSGVSMNIEYNDLLVTEESRLAAWSKLFDDLSHLPERWDELAINSLPQKTLTLLPKCMPTAFHLTVEEQQHPWIIGLDTGTDTIETILARFSKNRRWQVRRSLKEYQRYGDPVITPAITQDQALTWFDRLGELHTKRWQRVGQPGSFAYPRWVAFHHHVIGHAFDRGEIQLLRVHCGERDIGYIYSFIWRGWVYMLQTGLTSESSNLLRPGYVSHLLAIIWNRKAGNSHYDFMCGDAEYKEVFARSGSPLFNILVQTRSSKLGLEHSLRRTVRLLRRLKESAASVFSRARDPRARPAR